MCVCVIEWDGDGPVELVDSVFTAVQLARERQWDGIVYVGRPMPIRVRPDGVVGCDVCHALFGRPHKTGCLTQPL